MILRFLDWCYDRLGGDRSLFLPVLVAGSALATAFALPFLAFAAALGGFYIGIGAVAGWYLAVLLLAAAHGVCDLVRR